MRVGRRTARAYAVRVRGVSTGTHGDPTYLRRLLNAPQMFPGSYSWSLLAMHECGEPQPEVPLAGIQSAHAHTQGCTEGRTRAIDSHTPARMPALMLNKSSRVMPGLRGTPAGIMTRSHPVRAASIAEVSSRLEGLCAETLQDVLACDKSTPTPACPQAKSMINLCTF